MGHANPFLARIFLGHGQKGGDESYRVYNDKKGRERKDREIKQVYHGLKASAKEGDAFIRWTKILGLEDEENVILASYFRNVEKVIMDSMLVGYLYFGV